MAKSRGNATAGESFPFPFFGNDLPASGGDGHYWALRFQKAPARKERAKLSRLLAGVLTRGFFVQREEWPWRWSKEWLVVSADEDESAPDDATEARFDALAQIEKALRAVHEVAPLAEVLGLSYDTPSGSSWDTWSRADGRKPSVRGTAIFRRGTADADVEQIRLADPGVEAGGGGELSIVEADKKVVPATKLAPPIAARLDAIQQQESRSDRVYSVTDTPAGQAVWYMSSVDRKAASEIALASGSTCTFMPLHGTSTQSFDRGRVDGDAEGWLLVAHPMREAVIEVHPATGSRRFVCHVPCGTTGRSRPLDSAIASWSRPPMGCFSSRVAFRWRSFRATASVTSRPCRLLAG